MFVRCWNASQAAKPSAIVFYFHGMHSHSGESYSRHHWHNVSKHNMVVFGLDQAGHGQSATDQTRGYVENWNFFIQDAISFVEDYAGKDEFKNVPFFLAGHSLGGGITIMTSIQAQKLKQEGSIWNLWLGSILFAPPIVQNVSPGWIQVQALTLVHSLGFSQYPLGPFPARHKFPSEDAYFEFMMDPFTYSGRMKLGFGFTLLEFINLLENSITEVDFPFLVFHGDKDEVTLLSGSQLLIEKSKTDAEKKRIVVFPDVKHNVMTFGCANQRAVPETIKWVQERLAAI